MKKILISSFIMASCASSHAQERVEITGTGFFSPPRQLSNDYHLPCRENDFHLRQSKEQLLLISAQPRADQIDLSQTGIAKAMLDPNLLGRLELRCAGQGLLIRYDGVSLERAAPRPFSMEWAYSLAQGFKAGVATKSGIPIPSRP